MEEWDLRAGVVCARRGLGLGVLIGRLIRGLVGAVVDGVKRDLEECV